MKRSIRIDVWLAVVGCVILSGLLIMAGFNRSVKKNTDILAGAYLLDMATSSGGVIDNALSRGVTREEILSVEGLAGNLAHAKLSIMESSYAYVVDFDGNMMYHPTVEKIGKSVENDVIKSLCAKLKAGEKAENKYESYMYKGELKYAAYYISPQNGFIVVIAVDADDILASFKRIMFIGTISLVVSVLISGLVGLFVASLIIKPIVALTKVNKRISSMDLTENEDLRKLSSMKNEIGEMARGVRELRLQLVDVVTKIQKQSVVLEQTVINLNDSMTNTVNSVDQVGQAMGEIADGASSQAEETQSAMNSIVSMGNIVESTNKALEILISYADKMKQSGETTQNVLGQLVETNAKAQEGIENIANQTKTTNASAVKISQAADIITNIADETNLLALNASIESARAGEWGRGFSVVADQISKLAAQSNESARQIGLVIDELLADSATAMETMENVKSIMNQQSDDMKHMENAVNDIRADIDSSINEMKEVSKKAEELNEERTVINGVVESLSAVAEENAAASEQTSSSIENIADIVSSITTQSSELQNVVADLESCVNVFNLDSEK